MILSKFQANKLGHVMCDSVLNVLKQEVSTNRKLSVRVGSGKKTYHSFYPLENKSEITFGVKMILSKQSCINMAKRWRSAREISQFNFFKGEISFKNLIIHTIIHEFAHLIQTERGERLHKSVHNTAFYSILKELYSKGYNLKLSEYIETHYKEIDEITFHNSEISSQPKIQQQNKNDTNFVNGQIQFKHPKTGKIITLNVIRKNLKTVTGRCIETGGEWRVGYGSIIKNENSQPQVAINKTIKQPNAENYSKIKIQHNGGMMLMDVLKKNTKTITARCVSSKLKYRVPYSLVLEYI